MPKPSRPQKVNSALDDTAADSRAGRRRSRFAWWAAALLAIVITAIYGRSVDAPFIFDDFNSIQTNETITSLWPLWSNGDRLGPLNTPKGAPTTARPVANLSFALNYWFGELDPSGYRWANIALHIGSTLLLAAIVRRTLRLPYFDGCVDSAADWLALAVALLWAVHPLQTEAVVYATQRTELMMAFFYLAILYCSLRYWAASSGDSKTDRPDRPDGAAAAFNAARMLWLALATLACLAGMGSKEMMASAPMVVLLFERTFVAGSFAEALRRSWPLYGGLACGWLLLFWLQLDSPHHESAGFELGVAGHEWWLTQTKVLLMYLKLVVWPWPLLIHYEVPYLDSLAESWMFLVPVVLLGLTTVFLLWRNHPAGVLMTAFFAILSPTLVVPIPTEIAAERRMYLPLAAIVSLLVVAAFHFVRQLSRREPKPARKAASGGATALRAFGAATVVIAVVFCAVSVRRLQAYESELTLWREVLQSQPHNHMAHLNTGVQLFNAGNLTEAMTHYREAVRLKPDSSQVHYNLGLAYLQMKEPLKAVDEFREAERLRPGSPRLTNNLGVALFIAGKNDEAIRVFEETLKLDPTMWRAHDNLGSALHRAGRHAEAAECFARALQINPLALDVYIRLVAAQARSNQPTAAIATAEKALQLARDQGKMATAEKIYAQLAAYRASLARSALEPTSSTAENTTPSN